MSQESIEGITKEYLRAIEDELQQAIKRANDFGATNLYDMLAYHMGWKGEQSVGERRGKRIRPLIVLLSCSAAGGEWTRALPGAAAVELVHNFSLIHDDIEDQSPLRRGRETVWKKWGISQAINTGDAMFALAHLESGRLAETVSPAVALTVEELLQSTCLHLTHGQHLDLAYELRQDLSIDDYWYMIEGKTAALIAASSEIGALAALCGGQTSNIYRKFGRLLGLAFQVQDDYLGIWGNSVLTGKSNQSDLVTGKITLPVVYGLSRAGQFSIRWNQGPIHPDEAHEISKLLEEEGGKEFAVAKAINLVNEALLALEEAHPLDQPGKALKKLALSLLDRQS